MLTHIRYTCGVSRSGWHLADCQRERKKKRKGWAAEIFFLSSRIKTLPTSAYKMPSVSIKERNTSWSQAVWSGNGSSSIRPAMLSIRRHARYDTDQRKMLKKKERTLASQLASCAPVSSERRCKLVGARGGRRVKHNSVMAKKAGWMKVTGVCQCLYRIVCLAHCNLAY